MESNEITFKVDAALASLIKSLRDRAEKENRGVHSVEYWMDECMSLGRKTLARQWDAAIQLRNERGFAESVKNVKPANPNNAQDVQRYFAEITSLQRKFGIGGAQAEVK